MYSLKQLIPLACLALAACGQPAQEDLRGSKMNPISDSSDSFYASVDGQRFRVPVHYVDANGRFRPSKELEGFGITAFLPTLRGLHGGESPLAINHDKVVIEVVGRGRAGPPAGEVIDRLIRLGAAQRADLNAELDLQEYRDSGGAREIYVGRGTHGSLMLLQCTIGGPQDQCKTDYYNEQGRYSLFYYYNKKHFDSWKKIDTDINAMIESWRVK